MENQNQTVNQFDNQNDSINEQNKTEEMSNPSKLIKKELLITLEKFVNELDIAFDYIDVSEIKKYMEKINSIEDVLKTFVNSFLQTFKGCESKLGFLALSTGKIKGKEFNILDDKIIMEGLLNLSVFKHENKNTKKIVCKYMYNLYMSCMILQFSFDDNLSLESLSQDLSSYFNVIQDQYKNINQDTNNASGSNDNSNSNGNGSNSNGKKGIRRANRNQNQLPQLEGVDDIMNTLFANQDMMKIASEFTNDIQKQNIDPMMILGSLMSGKPNKQITNLINQISGKLEQKLVSGELDKGVFEQQATNLMNTLKNSNITSQLPVLNTILENNDITKFK